MCSPGGNPARSGSMGEGRPRPGQAHPAQVHRAGVALPPLRAVHDHRGRRAVAHSVPGHMLAYMWRESKAEFGGMRLSAMRPSHVKTWTAGLRMEGKQSNDGTLGPLAVSYVYACHARLAQIMSDAVAMLAP